MRIMKVMIIGAIIFCAAIACSETAINLNALKDIQNIRLLADDILGGGKVSKDMMAELKSQGVQSVIDLRTAFEGTIFGKSAAEKTGLKYFNIPIKGADITENEVSALKEILSKPENRPAIIHCAAGGRVFALWEQYQQSNE